MTPLPQTIDRTQRHTLRELARHVADIAALPIQHTRSNLIRLLNDLNPMRPVVLAFPEGGWRELLPEASLTTTHPLLRQWESHLRATIFRHQMIGDDYPITNFFNIPWQITRSDLGLTETRSRTEVTGSYHWDAPVKSRADFQRLHHTSIQVDRPATFAIRDLAHELFADILTVRIHGSHWWTVGLTQTLVHLRGLDQMMLDMYDDPQLLHDLMAFLRDDMMQQLTTFETSGLLNLNNGPDDYVGSGGLGSTADLPQADFTGHVRIKDIWGLSESQETVGVGPQQFAEFILPYQQPLMDRFGLVCYGCCEPIEKRLDMLIAGTKNLRRLSISPWCDRRIAAEKLAANYVFSYKPNPSFICSPQPDWQAAETALRETLDIARNCCVEMIMKDTHTFCNDPTRIAKWVTLALNLAQS